MKKTLKKIGLSTALAAILLTSSLNAGSVAGFGGSLEVTQWGKWIWEQTTKWPPELIELQNNVKKFNKWKDQMMAYKQLVNNIGSFPKQMKAKFINELGEMKKMIEFGDALSYTASSFDMDFKNEFKGFDEWLRLAKGGNLDFQGTYKQLSDTSRDTIKGAMKALQFQEKDLKSDASFMHAVHSKMKTAKGEKEMLLIANELAVHQTERMKSLQKTIMTQINMQGQYYAMKNEKSEVKQAAMEAMRKPINSTSNSSPTKLP
jgi:P-type conjugative transfer protein TrbJ